MNPPPPCSPLAAPAVSIITPVYNSAATLGRMLHSVLDQSLENIEHILIDDGSTDGSGALLDEYRDANPQRQITVIHQSNSGVPAYNPGLELARGEYVAFLDHDDYLSANFCEVLYCRAVAEQADICKGECVFFSHDGRCGPPLRSNAVIRSLHSRLCFVYLFNTAIYKLQLLREHGIYFKSEIGFSQDSVFQNEAVLACRHLALADEALVYHCHHLGSASNPSAGFNTRQVDAVIASQICIMTNIARHQQHCEPLGVAYLVSNLLRVLLNAVAGAVQKSADGERCWACAREMLDICPVHFRPLVWVAFTRSFPQLAAQLRSLCHNKQAGAGTVHAAAGGKTALP